eukprot:2379199-Pleurochrysis_carterae.AAC.1
MLEGSSNARAEHGGHVECEVDRGVVELFVHLVDETRCPQDQHRCGHANQFGRAHSTIKRGIKIQMRNVSH